MSDVMQAPAISSTPDVMDTNPSLCIKHEEDRMPASMLVDREGFDGAFIRRFSYISADKSLAIGTWESEAGTLVCDYYPNEEACLVLEGVLEVTNASGSTAEYRVGDSFVLPKGWKGVWKMKTRFKKQFAAVDWDFG